MYLLLNVNIPIINPNSICIVTSFKIASFPIVEGSTGFKKPNRENASDSNVYVVRTVMIDKKLFFFIFILLSTG